MKNNSKAIITSTSNKFFPSLLNLISSIKTNYPNHPQIYVYDLGLNFIFKKYLEKIDGVKVLEVPNFVSFWRSCYTWKTYIFNTPLAELNLYLDAGNQVLRELNDLFDKIETQGYLIVSAGDDVKNKDLIPQEYLSLFNLEENFLKSGIITAGIFGFNKNNNVVKSLTEELYDCGVSGLCLGFSNTEQWKNKGLNKNIFIRNAKYFRHDNTLFCILVSKKINNVKIEPMSNFNTNYTKDPLQYIWNLRLNYKKLDYVFLDTSKASFLIKIVVNFYLKSFLILKEINRIMKKNKYE
jgi:hypothetical protein